MARNFNAASTYYQRASPPVSATPLTFACWVFFSSISPGSGVRWSIFSLSSSASNYVDLCLLGSATASLRLPTARVRDAFGGLLTVTHPTLPTINVWQHWAMSVSVSGSSYTVNLYLNGVKKSSTISDDTGPTGMTTYTIGNSAQSLSANQLLNGTLDKAAVWNVALTDNDILALSQGWSPELVRKDALQMYHRLDGLITNEPDYSGGAYNLTLTGTPSAVNGAPVVSPDFSLVGGLSA